MRSRGLFRNSHNNQTVGVVGEIQAQDGGEDKETKCKGKRTTVLSVTVEDHIAHAGAFLCI